MNILLIHSAYGLRPAVHHMAKTFRDAGHSVSVPDLFSGAIASDLREARRLRERWSMEELERRARSAIPNDQRLVVCGLSMGAALAVGLAVDRALPIAGLLLFHGTKLPRGRAALRIPVQVHVAVSDPFEPRTQVAAWAAHMIRRGADLSVVFHDSGGHLFTDAGLPDYSETATSRALDRARSFLEDLDTAASRYESPSVAISLPPYSTPAARSSR